jgi:hypothetical protein
VIDLSPPAPALAALGLAAVFPPLLAALARLPRLAGRNGLQFLAAAGGMALAWVAALALARPSAEDAAIGTMLLAGALLVYLEAWALLSRGYTLGVLLTLLAAGRPLDERAIAERYRGGDSLSWIIGHRLSGLVGARLVRLDGDEVRLTPLGALVARAYRMSVRALGLRRTG